MDADERLLDHYKHPRRQGSLDTPTVRYRDTNPYCGDEVTIELQIEDQRVVDSAFDGRGCLLSLASASILLDEIVGKPVAEIATIDKEMLLALLDIEIGPVRQKCALLPLNVLHACLAHKERQIDE